MSYTNPAMDNAAMSYTNPAMDNAAMSYTNPAMDNAAMSYTKPAMDNAAMNYTNPASPDKQQFTGYNNDMQFYIGESSPINVNRNQPPLLDVTSPYHMPHQSQAYNQHHHEEQPRQPYDYHNNMDDDFNGVVSNEKDISLEMIYTGNDVLQSEDITTPYVNTSIDISPLKGNSIDNDSYMTSTLIYDNDPQLRYHATELNDIHSTSSVHSTRSADISVSNQSIKGRASLPYPWIEYLSQEGWPYYYNDQTGESRWERPIKANDHVDDVKKASSSVNAQGQSPLHISAAETALEGLSILLQSGLSPNLLNAQGLSALQILCSLPCSERQIQCMKVLLDFGATVNCFDSQGNSLLHVCVKAGNSEGIKLLLQYQADCSLINVDHDTALHLAAKLNQVQCMQTLVLGDRAVTNSSFQSQASLQTHESRIDDNAISTRNFSIQNDDDDNLNFQDIDETLSLKSQPFDARYAAVDDKKRLREAGWVKYKTPHGETYYHNEVDDRVQWEYPLLPQPPSASKTTNSDIDASTQPTQPKSSMSTRQVDPRDITPKGINGSMRTSVVSNYATAARSHQATQSSSSSSGKRNIESYIQQVESVVYASKHQTSQEVQPEPKRPERVAKPLKRRDSFESLSVISDLSEEGSVSAKQKHLQVWNRFFENAISAKESNSVEGATNLFKRKETSVGGFSPSKSNVKANKSKWPEVPSDKLFDEALTTVRRSHASNEQSAAVEIGKNNALIFAVLRGDIGVTEELLLVGANATCVDEQIRSPAHFACRSGNVEVLALLYDHGADFEAYDMFGRTPLHIACAYGHEDVIRFLLESAVEVDMQDHSGNSALHISARAGYAACCQLLLSYGANMTMRNKLGLDVLTTVQSIQPRNPYIQEVEHVLMQQGFRTTGSISSDSERKKDKKRSSQKQNGSSSSGGSGGGGNNSIPIGTEETVPKGNREQVAKNLTKRGSEQLERTRGIADMGEPPKQPWANLIIDTSVLKPSATTNTSSAPNTVTLSQTYVQSSTIESEANDNTDNSDDDDDDDDYNSVGNSVSEALWGVATSLIGVTINMFSKGKKGDGRPSWLTRKGALPMPSHLTQEESNNLTKWALSQAPPTDAELHQIGLGYNSAPPAALKDQINAQVESIKTGRTPRRINPQAPAEVKMALAYAKVEVERLRTSPKNEEEGVKPSAPPTYIQQPPTFPLASVNMSGHHGNADQNSVNAAYQNVYSIGGSLPRGVAWRYVDVLNEEGRLPFNK